MNEKTTYKIYDEVKPYTIKDARIVMLLAESRKLKAENERLREALQAIYEKAFVAAEVEIEQIAEEALEEDEKGS